jgi:hypothetical protein
MPSWLKGNRTTSPHQASRGRFQRTRANPSYHANFLTVLGRYPARLEAGRGRAKGEKPQANTLTSDETRRSYKRGYPLRFGSEFRVSGAR